jgi:hypothetical protein
MNRSFFHLRISTLQRDYLWTCPGDRWLTAQQQIARETRTVEIVKASLEQRRIWRVEIIDRPIKLRF